MSEQRTFVTSTEEEWLTLRGRYVTASQAAVLVGLNPYSSPAKLRAPPPFTGNAFTIVGQVLEPVVVDVTNRVMGTSFKLFEQEPGTKLFYTCDHLGATPDAFDEDILLECKTTRPFTFVKYSQNPPLNYLVQCQVQMECTRMSKCLLSILSTDLTQDSAELCWPITTYEMLHSEELCSILQKEAERFKNETPEKLFRVDKDNKQRAQKLLEKSVIGIYRNGDRQGKPT